MRVWSGLINSQCTPLERCTSSASVARASIRRSGATPTGASPCVMPLESCRVCSICWANCCACAASGRCAFASFLAEGLGQQRDRRELLAESVVNVLADAFLLPRAGLDDLALQLAALTDVAHQQHIEAHVIDLGAHHLGGKQGAVPAHALAQPGPRRFGRVLGQLLHDVAIVAAGRSSQQKAFQRLADRLVRWAVE